MNRRSFLRSLFASAVPIVVAPAAALEALEALASPRRAYFDMGRSQVIEQPWTMTLRPGEGPHSIQIDPPMQLERGQSLVIRWTEFTPEERVRTFASGAWSIVRKP